MSVEIPASHLHLFRRPLVATLITVMPDGLPQGTVVWCRLHEDRVQVSITDDTQKYRNVQENPNVSLVIVDPENPFHYIEVRGTVSLSRENSTEIIKDIARKYLRPDYNVERSADKRVIMTIHPTKVIPHGE